MWLHQGDHAITLHNPHATVPIVQCRMREKLAHRPLQVFNCSMRLSLLVTIVALGIIYVTLWCIHQRTDFGFHEFFFFPLKKSSTNVTAVT